MSVSAESIEAFIPSYPDISDPDFTYQISRKKEFNELYLESSEQVPAHGELLETQKFMKRFFSAETPYTEALLYHEPGTGKSCSASAILENFKSLEVGGKPRKPALFFVKSEDLARNIAQEIAMRCTKEIYNPKPTAAEIKKGVVMTEEARVMRLNRAIAQTYEIVTFETFLKDLPSDEEIVRKYSDRNIVIDESHALRIQPTRKKKKGGIEGILEANEEEEIDRGNAVMLYAEMHRFLHLLNGRKLLLTGTPIWDRAAEIASQLNLILPGDQQLPTGSAFDARYFDGDGKLIEGYEQELRRAFQGRVSFLRQMMTTAKRIEMGVKAPWLKHVTVFPDGMSESQAALAREARDAIESKTIKVRGKMVEREVKGGTVLKLARDAMNMVIPTFDSSGTVTGAEYGPEAFKKYVVKETKRRGAKGKISTVKTYGIDPRSFLGKEIKNNLREWSAKFSAIIEDIKAHPNEVTFIFNEEVTGPGGAIMLGLCMQIHGFSWAKTAGDIVRPVKENDARRFAIITSDSQTTSQSKQVQDLIASSNNDGSYKSLPTNKYGDRLQVIIGSEKIALGLSIKNVRSIHIVMPHWNIPFLDQAAARGFRFGGHDALSPEERTIRIFKHVAVEQPEAGEKKFATGKGYPADASFTDYETTDIYIYKIAEAKEYKNTQLYRLLKEEAFDCAAFYKRNVLETDVPNTRECDYQECNYQCDGFPLKESKKKGKIWDYSIPAANLDYSTYNLFFSTGRLREIIDATVGLFNNYFSVLIDTVGLLLEIPDEEKDLLYQAIDIIINSRILIRNRYGFSSYLKESGNILFLDNTISPNANYPESTYIENPIVTEITTMDSLVEILDLERSYDAVLKFCKAPAKSGFDKILYKTKIVLLEAAYARSKDTKKLEAATSIVLDEMGGNIYTTKDGIDVHILYNEEFKGVAYDVATKDIKATGYMRKYNPDTKQWSYTETWEEEEKYVAEIRTILSGKREIGFENNPYGAFGWISKRDGSFRINLKQEPGKTGKIRGRKCENFQVPYLISIFIDRLEYFPTPLGVYEDIDREDLLQHIKGRPGFASLKKVIEKYDDDQLRSILTLMTYHTEELCKLLMEWFETKDLLYSM